MRLVLQVRMRVHIVRTLSAHENSKYKCERALFSVEFHRKAHHNERKYATKVLKRAAISATTIQSTIEPIIVADHSMCTHCNRQQMDDRYCAVEGVQLRAESRK